MIKSTFADFLQFLKNPDDRQLDIGFRNKMQLSLILFSAMVLVTFIAVVPALLLIEDYLKLEFNDDFDISSSQIFLYAVLIMPFVEELIFRYFLRRECISTALLRNVNWDKIFPYLIYSSSIAFGLVHLTNFANDSVLFYIFSPIIVIAQLMMGFVLSYLRVRLNFLWGWCYHALWNFFFALVVPAIENFVGF